MTTLAWSLLQSPTVEAIGWVLVHFLWQGALVALVAALSLRLLARRRAETRYAIACLALAVMAAMPVATFVTIVRGGTPTSVTPSPVALDAAAPGMPFASPPASVVRWRMGTEAALPILVACWAAGVCFLSLRLVSGFVAVERLCRRTTELPAAVLAAARHLADRLGISAAVRFARSTAVQVPTVVGWLRPIILVPASAITGLSQQQLETLLAHELAHIRRHDYVVNLLQSVVETALFYHPAAWWISQQIRAERENCCDDVVVELYADRLLYARALTELEALRRLPLGPALAANGGSLRDRVLRLVHGREAVCSQRGRASMAAALVAAGMVLVPMAVLGREVTHRVAGLQLARMAPARLVIDLFTDEPLVPQDHGGGGARAVATLADTSTAADGAPDEPDAEPREPRRHETTERPVNEEIERIIQRRMFGVTEELAEAIAAAGYSASEEQLVELRIHDVTPEYIDTMNAVGFGRLALEQLLELRVHDVTLEYIDAMNAVGFGRLALEQLLELRVHDITPADIEAMNALGYGRLGLEQLVAFRIHGVDRDFVEEMTAAAGHRLSPSEIVELAVHEVTPATFDAAREMFGEVSVDDVIGAKIHGVTPAFLAEMGERGYSLRDVEKATEARIHGVTAELVDDLRAAGFSDIPLDELVRMRIFDVTVDDVRGARAAGYDDITIDQLIRLRMAGIDPSQLPSRDR